MTTFVYLHALLCIHSEVCGVDTGDVSLLNFLSAFMPTTARGLFQDLIRNGKIANNYRNCSLSPFNDGQLSPFLPSCPSPRSYIRHNKIYTAMDN